MLDRACCHVQRSGSDRFDSVSHFGFDPIRPPLVVEAQPVLPEGTKRATSVNVPLPSLHLFWNYFFKSGVRVCSNTKLA